MNAPGRPEWVIRVQRQGLSPALMEKYLAAGWPVRAIAQDRHLSEADVRAAMARWDMQEVKNGLPSAPT